MPAVAINGYSWDYYIFFEMDKNLVRVFDPCDWMEGRDLILLTLAGLQIMAGLYHFGTTATLNGIWAIFYRLHIIMSWGVTTYKDWFRAHVVAWAQLVVDEAAKLDDGAMT